MFPSHIEDLAEKVVAAYVADKRMLVTAESCTGGLVAGALTGVPGASSVLERGFVTYSNEAKTEALGVLAETIERLGAVSAGVAEEMASGALAFSRADVAVSVTGIAGPGGGSAEKPVGLVYFGLATRDGQLMNYKCQFLGDRDAIRMQVVAEALKLVLSISK